LAVAIVTASCAPRGLALSQTRAERQIFGLYKGRIEDGAEKPRRFRLLLYADLPDRVHGEVLSPLGTPQLIVDGGAGRLAVTFVREGESFVGPSSAEDLGRILGVRLGLRDLVRALLTGECDSGDYRLDRSDDPVPGLPQTLSIRGRSSSLTLDLRRLRPVAADPAALGTGQPPAGTTVRPLGDLAPRDPRLRQLTTVESAP